MIRCGVFLVAVILTSIPTEFQARQKTTDPDPPKWPSKYYVEGTLNLPYAEISEPFAAWYDSSMNSSRIDYYGGISKTIQRGDLFEYGAYYMVAPVTTELVANQETCFIVNGTSSSAVGPQMILPDTSGFKYDGTMNWNSLNVDVWKLEYTYGNKVNRYFLYIDKSNMQPVFYEMLGYDTLLGSHFDEYKLYYRIYKEDFSGDVFDIPESCQDFTSTSTASSYEAKIIANPMKEFVHPVDDSHVHQMYSEFVSKYQKLNVGETKKHSFKHNLRYINSMNRQKLSYSLKVNHLADHSPRELRRLRGRKTTPVKDRKQKHSKPFVSAMRPEEVPAEVNWRLRGAVTPVKDQGTCGSCWSFGVTGTIEGAHFLKTGNLVKLSEQSLMDCSWGYGNMGCAGGQEFEAYEFIIKHQGIATELSYGQYLNIDGFCHMSDAKIGAQISSYVNVTPGSADALKEAIATKGPVAVGIDADHLSFFFYANGVYYEPNCGSAIADLDHAVLAVGYGTLDGKPYWLVKNSWSTHWGNDGYILMSQKDNNCGVTTDASYVNAKK